MTPKIGRPNLKFVNENTTGADIVRSRNRPTSTPASIFHTPKPQNLFSSGFVHCCVVRDRTILPSLANQNPVYTFTFQSIGGESEKVVMVAQKQGNSIRIFDTTRLQYSGSMRRLNKKSGNYIGKLKRDKNDTHCFSLYDSNVERQELAAFVFSSLPLIQQLKDGIPPRTLNMAIPHVDNDGAMERLPPYLNLRMIESIKRNVSTGMLNFNSKNPTFDRGQYRLNFNGRVTIASVKNIQIVAGGDKKQEENKNEHDEMFAQFGKVGKKVVFQ